MILDFASWSVYWQLTSLFTSRIGQLWTLARLNDVRGISMLSAKIGERQKQVTARYFICVWQCLICTDVALIWAHNSTVFATCFNVKVKNLSFDTSKVITNAWFSMKNYGWRHLSTKWETKFSFIISLLSALIDTLMLIKICKCILCIVLLFHPGFGHSPLSMCWVFHVFSVSCFSSTPSCIWN